MAPVARDQEDLGQRYRVERGKLLSPHWLPTRRPCCDLPLRGRSRRCRSDAVSWKTRTSSTTSSGRVDSWRDRDSRLHRFAGSVSVVEPADCSRSDTVQQRVVRAGALSSAPLPHPLVESAHGGLVLRQAPKEVRHHLLGAG